MAAQDTSQTGYTDILSVIRKWPIEERLALMQDILRTLAPSDDLPPPKNTWTQAAGLLAGPWPAPSDEDVQRMLDESRAEKHG